MALLAWSWAEVRRAPTSRERYPYLSSECALVRHAARPENLSWACAWELSSWLWRLGARVQPGKPEVGFFEVTLDPISCYDPFGEGCPPSLSPHIGTATFLIFRPAACGSGPPHSHRINFSGTVTRFMAFNSTWK